MRDSLSCPLTPENSWSFALRGKDFDLLVTSTNSICMILRAFVAHVLLTFLERLIGRAGCFNSVLSTTLMREITTLEWLSRLKTRRWLLVVLLLHTFTRIRTILSSISILLGLRCLLFLRRYSCAGLFHPPGHARSREKRNRKPPKSTGPSRALGMNGLGI